MSELIKSEQNAGNANAIMAVIERVAMSPDADIQKLQHMMDMQERWMDRNAKQSFSAAISKMQAEIPEVTERAKAHNTKYASFEDINAAVRPVLHKHGFAITFRVDQEQQGIVKVTAVLSHCNGHSEDTCIILPYDTSGSKNAVQAVGSSISYGKRYTMSALLNIATRGEDDDANGAVRQKFVTAIQAKMIGDMARSADPELQNWLGATYGSPDRVPASDYNDVMAQLNGASK